MAAQLGTEMDTARLSVRIIGHNPNHHLWNNHGRWWCHYTVHRPDYTKMRCRVSLDTANLDVARRRRDNLLGITLGGST